MADTIKLNDYEIDLRGFTDELVLGVVKHDIPNRNGPILQNSGLSEHGTNFLSVWTGDKYQLHKAFLKDVITLREWELAHPEYGTLKGMITRASVTHDDGIDYCEISISFIEGAAETSGYVVLPSIEKEQEELFTGVVEAAKVEATQDFASMTNYVKTQITNQMRAAEKMLSGITIPATSITSLIEYTNDLPNQFVSTYVNAIERYMTAITAAESSPEIVLMNTSVQLRKLIAPLSGVSLKNMLLLCAARYCLEAGYAYAKDEINRSKYRRQESQSIFDLQGNFVPPDPLPEIMTVQSIERTLADVRTMVQQAIDLRSATDSSKLNTEFSDLKTMVKSLLVHVNKIKLEVEKVITVDIKTETPLHLICMRYGLSYRYAERIMAINNIKNPTFVKGVISIYAR